jgi:uncharacterized protein (TIGR02147 family)
MVYETQNYRSFLKATLAEKAQKNPQFSLRAFSQFLGLTHGALGQVLRGNKNLSFDRAVDIANKLKLSKREKDYFCTLVQFEAAKNPETKIELLEKLNRLRPNSTINHVSVDTFKAMSEWYHLPILTMTGLAGFVFNTKNIAIRLGITPIDASIAIDRLQRLGLLKEENGVWSQTGGRILASSDGPNKGLRQFHKQLLEKAITALEEQGPEEKINGSETFAFSQNKVARAKEITEEYYERMLALANEEDKTGPTDVYHLQVNCFNLTKNTKTLNKEPV